MQFYQLLRSTSVSLKPMVFPERPLQENEKLNHLNSDDAYLERFLYAKEFNVDEAYITMKMFYELLEEFPEWFSLGSPVDQKSIIDKNIRILTREHDKEGRIIYIVKIGNMDASKMDLLDIVAVDDLLLESCLIYNRDVCEKGLCVVVDISNFSWKLMRWLTPHNMQTAIRRLTSMPIKDYKFHVVNSAFIVHAALKILLPFLPLHFKESMKLHFNDRNSLYRYVDREALPVEYGGDKDIDYEKYQCALYESQAELAESFKINRRLFLDNLVLSDKDKNKKCK